MIVHFISWVLDKKIKNKKIMIREIIGPGQKGLNKSRFKEKIKENYWSRVEICPARHFALDDFYVGSKIATKGYCRRSLICIVHCVNTIFVRKIHSNEIYGDILFWATLVFSRTIESNSRVKCWCTMLYCMPLWYRNQCDDEIDKYQWGDEVDK